MAECKKCGECCKWVAVAVNQGAMVDEEWVWSHGGYLHENVVFLPCRCKMLTEDNLCLVHADNMIPAVCKHTPTWEGRHMFPEKCKYWEDA